MAKLFFSKMNVNDEIFEVYKGKTDLNKLLTSIYNGVTNKVQIYDEYGGRYKFFDIDKFEDNSIIRGRLGYIKKVFIQVMILKMIQRLTLKIKTRSNI